MLERLRHPLGLGRVRDDLTAACVAGTDAVIVSHDPPRVCRGRFGECGMRTLTVELRLDRALPHFEPGALCTVSYAHGGDACTFSARVEDFFPAERVGDRPVLVLGHPKEIATEGARGALAGRLPREIRFRPLGLGFQVIVPLTLDADTWLKVESAHGVVLELHRYSREQRARRARGEAPTGVFARLVRGDARGAAKEALGKVAARLIQRSPARWWTREDAPGSRVPSTPGLAKPAPGPPRPTRGVRSSRPVPRAVPSPASRHERAEPRAVATSGRRASSRGRVRFLP